MFNINSISFLGGGGGGGGLGLDILGRPIALEVDVSGDTHASKTQ